MAPISTFWALAALLLTGSCPLSLAGKIWNSRLKQHLDTTPENQHIPIDSALRSFRPLPPQLPTTIADSKLFIGISSFRDGERCGRTLYSAFDNSTAPERVYVGIVDQLAAGEVSCLDNYCALVASRGIRGQKPQDLVGKCPYKDQIRSFEMPSRDSRGPNVARSHQQNLLQDEEFCLQIDAHSILFDKWDSDMITDWTKANNEMAVLSTYIHDCEATWTKGMNFIPHLCATTRGSYGMVRNEGASVVTANGIPQLSHLWGAGFSFSKCHTERDVRIDPHTPWIFDGEEFMRSARLWTHGYDIYSPSTLSVCHDYKPVPHRYGTDADAPDAKTRDQEVTKSANRMKSILGQPLSHDSAMFEEDLNSYRLGTIRSREQFLQFSGVDLQTGKDVDRCQQLYWVPYDVLGLPRSNKNTGKDVATLAHHKEAELPKSEEARRLRQQKKETPDAEVSTALLTPGAKEMQEGRGKSVEGEVKIEVKLEVDVPPVTDNTLSVPRSKEGDDSASPPSAEETDEGKPTVEEVEEMIESEDKDKTAENNSINRLRNRQDSEQRDKRQDVLHLSQDDSLHLGSEVDYWVIITRVLGFGAVISLLGLLRRTGNPKRLQYDNSKFA